jgi:hypothetical protein
MKMEKKDKQEILSVNNLAKTEQLDLSPDIIHFKDNFLIPQTSITDITELLTSRLNIDNVWKSPYFEQKSLTYNYIAPAFSCFTMDNTRKNHLLLTKGLYLHKGYPLGLAMTIFPLLLAGITNPHSKYYNKAILDVIYNKLSIMSVRSDLPGKKNGA